MLERLKQARVMGEPFPHLVLEDALPPDICEALIATFPESEILRQGGEKGSNLRYSFPKVAADQQGEISDIWKKTLATFVSYDFYAIISSLFHDHCLISETKRWLKTKPESLGIRGQDTFEKKDVLLDALICENTPVVAKPTSVRKAHVDDKRKIFAGLLYLRPDFDHSEGGDLEVFQLNTTRPKFRGHSINPRQIKCVKTIPYKKNTLILFLNTPQAIHAVTKRQQTPNRRIFLNLVGEVENPIFQLEQESPSMTERFFEKLKGQARRILKPS